MGESTSPPIPNPEKKPSLCEECVSNPWKYRCPGCSIVTCSLPCVKAHKERTSCTGKRSRTDFVPKPKFDDNLLLSDYNLLEETKRVAESARRVIAAFGSNIKISQLPYRYQLLLNAVYRRRARLLILPRGMSKREKNQSRFDRRNNCIYWTVEWRFHSTDVVLMDHGVDEHASLSSIIEKHLAPSPWHDPLTPFCNTNLDDLQLFIRKNAKGMNSPYRKLDIRVPLAQQLQNTVIVEYPVIHVFLPSEINGFQVEEKSFAKKVKREQGHCKRVNCNDASPLTSSGISSPKGTLFREEEIEEGELPSDTQVLDLMDRITSKPNCQSPIEKPAIICTKEESQPDKKMRILVKSMETFPAVKHQATPKEATAYFAGVVPTMLAEDDNFDFEQEVKDAYSDLIGEIDPDEFLCFDGEFTGGDDFGDSLFGDGELEEGEIPSY